MEDILFLQSICTAGQSESGNMHYADPLTLTTPGALQHELHLITLAYEGQDLQPI